MKFDSVILVMKRTFFLFLISNLLFNSCEKKEPTSYLWLLALLGSNSSQNSNSIPETPIPIQDPTVPTTIHLTILDPPSTGEFCPMYGGLFIQYKKGDLKTCASNELNANCVTFLYNEDGSIKTADPRSFVGLSMVEDREIPAETFPSNSKSNLICFRQQFPKDKEHVEMYSFQLQTNKLKNIQCDTSWSENQCIDFFPIFGRAEFLMPKEFPILANDGDGHAGSHTLLLKFVTEDSLFTTCTFFGNEHRKLEGYVENAYIAGNLQNGSDLGSCKQCETNYCGTTNPNTGQLYDSNPINVFPIPVGTLVTIQKEMILQVVKGQGPGKHSVRWNINGFNQWILSNQMPIFLSNSNVLFAFLLPILITMFVVVLKLQKRRRHKD